MVLTVSHVLLDEVNTDSLCVGVEREKLPPC